VLATASGGQRAAFQPPALGDELFRQEAGLKTIFSTTGVHARERFDYWHDVACKNLVEHDSNPECR
jgi:hypothetical protein